VANSIGIQASKNMITRSDIIWLGVAAGVGGGFVGRTMLGVGKTMIRSGTPSL